MASIELSMVIPVRDEIDAVDSLVNRVVAALSHLDVENFEVICSTTIFVLLDIYMYLVYISKILQHDHDFL